MIRGYDDHAANERTFLAWLRTSIAVIAFGFVVEKLNLVSAFIRPSMTSYYAAAALRVPYQSQGPEITSHSSSSRSPIAD
jgi:Domain of unknown function (DUF202)